MEREIFQEAESMNIHGLQKMTLLDYPGKVACTVFLGGCDFRCPYCHNAELLDGSVPPVMEESELLSFLQKRRGLLDGVCITGGEPLLRPELPQLIAAIREMGYAIKLDTNGNHPEQLRKLAEAGLLDYVAMDIKNAPERYGQTVGVPGLDLTAIRESVDFLMSGTLDYEFRTTVVEQLHDADSFRSIGAWLQGARRYFLQFFVDRDTVLCPGLTAPDAETTERYAEILRPYIREVEIRGQ